MGEVREYSYGTAILSAFEYLLDHYPEVFVIGQGLWSPWYVGSSMTDLDKKYGVNRIIDTPVSEAACTGAAVGASLSGMKPIIVHPRMDFMLYAMDAIVNQAAKWSHMLGGKAHAGLTIRAIINRGGEQGAQHSQALHSWFSHVPGLRVVMPATVADARNLLIASVLSPDPVMYIDDRWLYEETDFLPPPDVVDLVQEKPQVIAEGGDITITAAGYSTNLALKARSLLAEDGISAEVVDLRILNPFDANTVIESVDKTGRLIVVDGGWRNCGLAGEVIASVAEAVPAEKWKSCPARVTLPDAPAPTSGSLEKLYYPDADRIVAEVKRIVA